MTPTCIRCKSDLGTRVIDSRREDGLGVRTVWRRRECMDCEARWTTMEVDKELFKWLKGLWEVMQRG